MRRRRMMGVISAGEPRINLVQTSSVKADLHHHGVVVEEIEGLIRLYKDGYVERFPVVPEVPCIWSPVAGVTSRDMVIDRSTGVSARFYLPTTFKKQLPLLVYFHGGGFCVGSAAWSVYHEFSARLVSKAGCVVMSVNYRLAPENRLPAAYEDGFAAVQWAARQGRSREASGESSGSWWWSRCCNFSRVFLGGDSAGACIAHNVAARSGSLLSIRGVILIQPFFGGEARTSSERSVVQPAGSVLSLAASDCYWRLALPAGTSRDHEWCNPVGVGREGELDLLPRLLVCVAEMDILREREVEYCKAVKRAGRVEVELVVHKGVGHGFQILGKSRACQARTQEMMAHIKAFLNGSR